MTMNLTARRYNRQFANDILWGSPFGTTLRGQATQLISA
jgi:hypothetical protein